MGRASIVVFVIVFAISDVYFEVGAKSLHISVLDEVIGFAS